MIVLIAFLLNMLVFVLGMGDNNFMAGAQEGVTFALNSLNSEKQNKNVSTKTCPGWARNSK